MTTETYQYRGYDIVPMWQWSSWCTGIYARRADLPIMSRSTLSTMAPEKDEAVAEAKHCIDRLLSRLIIGGERACVKLNRAFRQPVSLAPNAFCSLGFGRRSFFYKQGGSAQANTPQTNTGLNSN